MRPLILLLALCAVLAPRPAAHAQAPANPAPVTKPVAPNPVTEQELTGEWGMGTFTDNEWLLTFRPDHTASVVLDGYAQFPIGPATWTLVGDTLTVTMTNKATPARFHILKVVRYKSSVVLVPQPRLKNVRDFDYSPDLCFWKFVMDKKHGERLPHDAANFMRFWERPLDTAPATP